MKKNPRKDPASLTQQPQSGSLSSSSIFDEAEEVSTTSDESLPSAVSSSSSAAALDPNPLARQRWTRRMTIRSIQADGQLSKAALLKRTERESLSKSRFFKTSIKKLGPLARQIQGKSLDEAITQMRFSKKKAAKEVLRHLEFARDKAIVARGMGLGNAEPVQLTVDGRERMVRDPTRMYIDQTWVGRGKYTPEPEYRARGRVNMLRHPTTSISVLLKEEYTRVRLAREQQTKIENRKVWTQLPERKITGQRQYYSW
jgi:ribosomal protein L22